MHSMSVTIDNVRDAPAAAAAAAAAAGETDHLAASVMKSLSRSFRNQFSISGGQALGLGLITFGLWPLLKLRRQFRDYVTFEKQQLWHATEWVRTRRGGSAAAAELADHMREARSRHHGGLAALVTLCLAGVAVLMFASMDGDLSWAGVMERTYRFRNIHRAWRQDDLVLGYVAWNIGLSLAYLFQWLRVRLHVNEVAAYGRRFNAVAAREAIPPVRPPQFESGIRAGWVVVAIILWMCGAMWGVPMAVAAAAQRRYINGVSMPVRAELLDRIRQMVAQHRPPVAIPGYVLHDRRCGNVQCRAALRAGAEFCPRCGTRAGVLGEVA